MNGVKNRQREYFYISTHPDEASFHGRQKSWIPFDRVESPDGQVVAFVQA